MISLVNSLFIIILTILIAIYGWFKKQYRFWKTLDIPGPKPVVPFGICFDMISKKKHYVELVTEMYREYNGLPYFGIYILHRPVLVLRDLDLIKNVLVKDYEYFNSKGFTDDLKHEPLLNNLFYAKGAEWQNMRKQLSPVFSPSKIKLMFPIMNEISLAFDKYLSEMFNQNEIIDFKQLFNAYNMSVISNCAFGIESNTMSSSVNEFQRKFVDAVVPTTLSRKIAFVMHVILPKLVVKLNMEIYGRELRNFFGNIIQQTITYRERNGIRREDFLQRLMELKSVNPDNISKEQKDAFVLKEIVPQAFFFILAGYETSASAQTFTLYELARNPEIQKKVRKQIIEILKQHDGKCTYECIMDMNCLEMIIDETLRKYPALGVLHRECTTPYKLGKDGPIIKEGTAIMIPLLGIQSDPNIFPYPEKFDPDRFLPENIALRHSASYMPFGEGPRICIGKRFAMIQSRLTVLRILTKYEVKVCETTPNKIELNPISVTISHKSGVFLKLQPLEAPILVKYYENI